MSTSIAVIGSGYIGTRIITALVATGTIKVVIVSRNPNPEALPSDAVIVKIDAYTNRDSLTAALTQHRISVVVCTVAATALEIQTSIADAAKAAGVKLFLPSEFGTSTEGAPEDAPLFYGKAQVAKHLESIGLPYVRIFNGAFIESFIPFMTGLDVNGKFNIVGTGLKPLTFTSEVDVSEFVAYILTHHSPSELSAMKMIRIEGDRASLVEIANMYNKEIVYVDAVPGPDSELRTTVAGIGDSGAGSTGWNWILKADGSGEAASNSGNKLWPGRKWKTIRDVHKQL